MQQGKEVFTIASMFKSPGTREEQMRRINNKQRAYEANETRWRHQQNAEVERGRIENVAFENSMRAYKPPSNHHSIVPNIPSTTAKAMAANSLSHAEFMKKHTLSNPKLSPTEWAKMLMEKQKMIKLAERKVQLARNALRANGNVNSDKHLKLKDAYANAAAKLNSLKVGGSKRKTRRQKKSRRD